MAAALPFAMRLLAVTLVLSVLGLAHAVPSKPHSRLRKSLLQQHQPADSGVADAVSAPMPCSCDCCSVASRLPSEETSLLKFKCVPPSAAAQSSTCPRECAASPADQVLSAASTKMLDYSRYCQYKCKPSTQTIGTMCLRLDATQVAQSSELDGNGNSDAAIYVPASNAKSSWQTAQEEAKAETATKAAAEAAASGAQVQNRFDMRPAIEARMAASAAADMTRASAIESQAKLAVMEAQQAQERTTQILTAVRPEAARALASQVNTKTFAKAARNEGMRTTHLAAKVKGVSTHAAVDAIKLAEARIAAAVSPFAKRLAKAHAYSWGWTKPEFWPRVLGNRAAEPYMQQMVAGVQRTDEYESFAHNLMVQAKAAQAKAQKLAPQMNQYNAMGDSAGATVLHEQIDGLLAKARSLETQAKAFYATAEGVRKSIPEWQNAGMMAQQRMIYDVANAFKQPKE